MRTYPNTPRLRLNPTPKEEQCNIDDLIAAVLEKSNGAIRLTNAQIYRAINLGIVPIIRTTFVIRIRPDMLNRAADDLIAFARESEVAA